MNAKPLVHITLRAVFTVLYKLARIYVGLVVTYGPSATILAVVFTLAGFGWGYHAAVLGIGTVGHYVLLRVLDVGYVRTCGALNRWRFA